MMTLKLPSDPCQGHQFVVTFGMDINGNSTTTTSSHWGKTRTQMSPQFNYGSFQGICEAVEDHLLKKLPNDIWELLAFSQSYTGKNVSFSVVGRYVKPVEKEKE